MHRKSGIRAGLEYALLWGMVALAQQSNSSVELPIVNLGYERHRAVSYDSVNDVYNFSNIRYAAPPMQDLRWRPPQPPANTIVVQEGLEGKVCPQAIPSWQYTEEAFVECLKKSEFSDCVARVSSSIGQTNATMLPLTDPRITEDCLFLDVLVPWSIFNAADNSSGAAVLVWIHGGGFTGGHKLSFKGGSPLGLLRSAGNNVIFVSLNYRLGALGFLAGPTLQSNGVANAGLLDQRFALDWVQKYIHLFGGDPKKVTVMGESAGGGSIMHQLTAYGGQKGKVPFSQAILQSPGFYPSTSAKEQDSTFHAFLQLLGAQNLNEARKKPTYAVMQANALQVLTGDIYGTFTFGPIVDGNFTPALPGKLLLDGGFDSSVKIMAAHNANEGFTFADPRLKNDSDYNAFLKKSFPTASSDVLKYINETLYPPVYDGSHGYKNVFQRTVLSVGEFVIDCNPFYLATAYKNQIYRYLFSVPPGFHGIDVPFTFYNGEAGSSVVTNATVATALQGFITSFAVNGTPKHLPNGQDYPVFGSDAEVVNLNQTVIDVIKDPTATDRCKWWQQALYA